MPPKKWKQKIGTKTNAGEVVVAKRFTNGHKSFTTAEARAMNEQQGRERSTAMEFEKNLSSMYRPRNPLTGEETPRDGSEYRFPRRVEAVLLIPKDRSPPRPAREKKLPTLKIGEQAWNSIEAKKPASLEELSELDLGVEDGSPTRRNMARIESLRVLQDGMTGELEYLQRRIREKTLRVQSSLSRNMVDTQAAAVNQNIILARTRGHIAC